MRRVARLYRAQDLRVEWIEDPPPPGEGQVQVRPRRIALCGSDLKLYLHPGSVPLASAHPVSGHYGPLIMGHEFVAEVVALGEGVTNLDRGQVVTSGSAWWCGTCPACLEGDIDLCKDYWVLGLAGDGALMQGCFNLPAKLCVPVPDPCTEESAVMAQPCAIASHALRLSGVRADTRLVVFGAGGIGSLIIALAHYQGVSEILAVDVNDAQLRRAQTLGATVLVNSSQSEDVLDAVATFTGGRGAELIIECTGNALMPNLALRAARRGGRIHLVGIPGELVAFDLGFQVQQQIQCTSSNGLHGLRDLPPALAALTSTALADVVRGPVISLDRVVEDGLKRMENHQVSGKVIVDVMQE